MQIVQCFKDPDRCAYDSQLLLLLLLLQQELVFIGIGLKEAELRGALDSCLVTIEEAESSGFSVLEDPFEPWPDVQDMIDAGEICSNLDLDPTAGQC